ncbi:hypothetical protein, unknown function [Leishmania tarentolae]|uniref:Uncharacterized protein n=1 Tax=Leishmania tarentolae TaxID=5689 RepID=A0A640K9A2_LEITA|nr:hypothetical protein, unknown function [Leishmania tarentolae]
MSSLPTSSPTPSTCPHPLPLTHTLSLARSPSHAHTHRERERARRSLCDPRALCKHSMEDSHHSANAAHARRSQIGDLQRAPPLAVSATSSLTEFLTILSYVIVFSLYLFGFVVLVLAMVHRWRAVRRVRMQRKQLCPSPAFPVAAGSDEAYSITGMKSEASSAQAVETPKKATTGDRRSLQISDLTVYRLMKLQSCMESDLDNEEQST